MVLGVARQLAKPCSFDELSLCVPVRLSAVGGASSGTPYISKHSAAVMPFRFETSAISSASRKKSGGKEGAAQPNRACAAVGDWTEQLRRLTLLPSLLDASGA